MTSAETKIVNPIGACDEEIVLFVERKLYNYLEINGNNSARVIVSEPSKAGVCKIQIKGRINEQLLGNVRALLEGFVTMRAHIKYGV